MKLAIVMDKLVKGLGQGRVNYEIARYALDHGVPTTFLATEVAPELREHAQANWVRLVRPKPPPAMLCNAVFAWRTARWLKRHRSEVDVVHANGNGTWAAADVNASHFVHDAWLRSPVHTSRLRRDLYGAYQWAYTRLNASGERKAYKQAKAVVAVSERVRQQLIATGIPQENIHVILNGVDLDEFHPSLPGDPPDRTALGLPPGVVGLFAGDIRTPRKNLDTVLRALVAVPEMQIAVVGSTEGSPYPALAQSLNVQDRVHFLGFRRDIAALMRASDLFVFPSRYEACSLVLLEALASGLPIITAVTTGGAEVVSDDCGVILPDPDDTEALAAVMRAFGDDPVKRRAMSQAARAVAERHSWSIMAAAYLDLYEKVASA